ncbi:MAG TPA: hypothetical protein PLD58_11860 [Phycisphaerae bacterium]|nr:hypothetical protein [Phycisphaerae bacterium]
MAECRACPRGAAWAALLAVTAGAALPAPALAAEPPAPSAASPDLPPQPPGPRFTGYGGSWEVRGDVLHAAGQQGPKLLYDPIDLADGEAGVEIFFSDRTAGNLALIVRVSRPAVGADAWHGYEVALDAAAGVLRLGRHRDNFELIRDVPCTVPVGRWVSLVVRLAGRTIEAVVDGKSVLLYEDTRHPLAGGKVGLRPWARAGQYRNLYVKTGDKPRPIPFGTGPTDWPDTLLLERLPPVVFLARHMLSAPPAVGCDHWAARPTRPGCAILVIDPSRPTQPPRTVFRDPEGCIYDLNLSLDARTVYFSYAPAGQHRWHLWRIGVDGSGLRQITDGPYYDVSPCELPDGDLVFVSTRRFGSTVCQPGPAGNLHRVSPMGSRPRCLSMNTLTDTTPQLLGDGRVLFMRWEYVDRDLTYRQSLWTQNPDGTGYQLFFGNTVREVGTFWQARPIPGLSHRVLATFASHHGYGNGAIGWIDVTAGPEAPRGVGYDWITREFPDIHDHPHAWAYRDPFPLDGRRFLCAYGGGGRQKYRIVLHDWQDRKRTVYEHPELHCFCPIPLRGTAVPAVRPTGVSPVEAEATLSGRTGAESTAGTAVVHTGRMPVPRDLPEHHPRDRQPMGTLALVDVYRGLEPTIARGRVKAIRIMEQVRKTEALTEHPTDEKVAFGNRAYDQNPLMSRATYYAKRCWGTVPVEADGSAHFLAPALREIYFQALDADGRELQRMTSACQLMPGEYLGCVGCHEPRTTAPPPPAGVPLAMRRAASVPVRPDWAGDGIIDFPTTVQPVLDKHCVRCHSGANPKGGYDFSGDKTRYFSMSYDNLLGRSRSYRQHDMAAGHMLPGEAAKGKPLVHYFWLLKTPTAVNQPLWAGSHASRLTEIIESDHAGKPLPPADRLRIYTWIDADAPYYGTYANSRVLCGGKRDLVDDPGTGRPAEWFARDFMGVFKRRCESCHGKDAMTWQRFDGSTAWINFTRPELSPALTAHQPKAREGDKTPGGRGIDKTADGKPISPFGPGDADFEIVLRAVRTGAELARRTPGPDMPGYAGRTAEP